MKEVHQYSVPLTKEQYAVLNQLNDLLVEAQDTQDAKGEEKAWANVRAVAAAFCNAAGFNLLAAHTWYYMESEKRGLTLDVYLKSENARCACVPALPVENTEREELAAFKAEMLAGLKEAYGQGDWQNIHLIIQELTARH